MNSYEAKQAQRRERYEDRAEKAEQSSQAAWEASRRATDGIPMGQPILVGHHSERRHRGALARSDSAMRRSVEESEKARYYAEKAASVGTGGISSDDPDALVKLRAELATIQAMQERMKAANKAIRANKTPEKQIPALVALGFSEEAANLIITPDFCGRVGFPSYKLSNNNANAKRIEKRIEQLEALRQRKTVEAETDGYRYREDSEENRVMFEFDGKPAEDIRAILKRHAFKWSPSRGAWVRQMTNAGIYAGQQVRKALDGLQKA